MSLCARCLGQHSDAVFVYIVAGKLLVPPPFTKLPFGFLPENTELCLLQINSMNASSSLTRHAYPSLLDPTSPQLLPGDGNFQYTANRPLGRLSLKEGLSARPCGPRSRRRSANAIA